MAFNTQRMNSLLENIIWFSKYSDFCLFDDFTNFKLCDIIMDITVQYYGHF